MSNEVHDKILVVEDERDLRFILTAHLRAAGYTVVTACNGYEGIEKAGEHLPDLIIMDVGLPKLDGVSATRAIKSDPVTQNIPVIMLTARSESEDVVRGLEAGAQEYLPKPFDMNELLARVQTVQRLSKARQKLDELNTKLEAEVDAKTKRLQLLYDFMRDLHQTTQRDPILSLIVRTVKRLTGAQRISLMLTDAEGENLVCERAIGIDPGVVEQIRVRSVDGIAGQVFQSGKTFSAKTYGRPNNQPAVYHGNAFLSTPLVSTSPSSNGGIMGVLNVTEKPKDAPFSEDEIECVRSIADAATIALDNVRRREQLEHSVKVLLRTVGHLAEYRDEETSLHLERVSKMSRILATELAKEGPYAAIVDSEHFIDMLVQAAPLHDIGKVGIPDEILTKPGKLTDEEFQIMKTHADIGRRVLSQALDPSNAVPLLDMCIEIAHCHHERFDGKGYPRRIEGDAIPLTARIIGLVDAYDAITSERRYSTARTHDKAVEIIREDSGAHFDPVVVEAFLRCHEEFRETRQRFGECPDERQTVSSL